MAKIDAFFKLMFDQGASDLHLVSGQQPILRMHGELERVKYKVLENDELKLMLYEIAPEMKIKIFEETGDVDFGYEIPGVARFRANFFNQKFGRRGPDRVRPPERRLHRESPRGGDAYQVVRSGLERGASRRPRHHPRRRNAGP